MIKSQKPVKMQVNQLRFESDGWKRVIAFILEENIFCRNHLSEVIKYGSGDVSILEAAENYLSIVALNEEHIQMLRSDIRIYDDLLIREIFEDGRIAVQVSHSRITLFNEVEKLKASYRAEKRIFDQFLEPNS